MSPFTHINASGDAHMVDVSDKGITKRLAIARGSVSMDTNTIILIKDGLAKKGDVLSVAQLAGIMGAKKAAELIPLCHPLSLSSVSVTLQAIDKPPQIAIEASVKTTGPTGVEMEALTAVSVAALTVYDMVKSVCRSMEIQDIRLVLKEGGKSAIYKGRQ